MSIYAVYRQQDICAYTLHIGFIYVQRLNWPVSVFLILLGTYLHSQVRFQGCSIPPCNGSSIDPVENRGLEPAHTETEILKVFLPFVLLILNNCIAIFI